MSLSGSRDRHELQGFPDTSQVSVHKTVKSNFLYYSSSCRKPRSDGCIQLYQSTHRNLAFNKDLINVVYSV